MMDACQNCLQTQQQQLRTVDDSSTQCDISMSKANQDERKRLVMDLEEAGVSFPVTELETMLHPKHLPDYQEQQQQRRQEQNDEEAGIRIPALGTATSNDTNDDDYYNEEEDETYAVHNTSSSSSSDSGDNNNNNSNNNNSLLPTTTEEELTSADYATAMPDHLKDLLRRHYNEDDSNKLGSLAGTQVSTTPIEKVPIRRAPFWFFRKQRCVAVLEQQQQEDDTESVEVQSHATHSKHALVEQGESTSRVTVVYPKESTRKVRLSMTLCCCLQLVLLALLLYFFVGRKDSIESSKTLADPEPDNTIVQEQVQTAPPTLFNITDILEEEDPLEDEELEDGCVSEVSLNKNCYVRGEPILVSFQNCNPETADWLAMFDESQSPDVLEVEDPLAWMYACGNKQCRGVVQSSLYTFQYFVEGSYQIHLIPNKAQGVGQAKASSHVFEVKENRLDCPAPLP